MNITREIDSQGTELQHLKYNPRKATRIIYLLVRYHCTLGLNILYSNENDRIRVV